MLEVYKLHTNCEAVGVWLCFAAKRILILEHYVKLFPKRAIVVSSGLRSKMTEIAPGITCR